MFGHVLQDWITVRRGTAGTAGDIIQGESTWVGFSSFQDIAIWLDVREPTMRTSSMGAVAPGFTPGVQLLDTGAIPKITPARNPVLPLATLVRWRLSPSAGTATPWDATFRVLVAANANRVMREPGASALQ